MKIEFDIDFWTFCEFMKFNFLYFSPKKILKPRRSQKTKTVAIIRLNINTSDYFTNL